MTPTPVIAPRERGGWMAVTPPGYPFRFGVFGPDEQATRARFAEAVDRWEAIAPSPDDGDTSPDLA